MQASRPRWFCRHAVAGVHGHSANMLARRLWKAAEAFCSFVASCGGSNNVASACWLLSVGVGHGCAEARVAAAAVTFLDGRGCLLLLLATCRLRGFATLHPCLFVWQSSAWQACVHPQSSHKPRWGIKKCAHFGQILRSQLPQFVPNYQNSVRS